ncbi:MAG TPA: hypothetical protein PKZ32_10430 [Candidatus Melainabacteria bacterium]|nr:hypothetical protein [Candidatus Melainabacteria bacterium]
MLRSEVGNGESDHKSSKATGSDSAALEADKAESGNGLAKEFSDTVVAKITSSACQDSGAAVKNEANGSASGQRTAEAGAATEQALADGKGTGMRANAAIESSLSAGARANGGEKKATEGTSGFSKLQPSGLGDAFPSSTQLLNQLKI